MADFLETEVLIIGCGIAGGVAALQLADAGIPVTVVKRAREPRESNTYYAQGGIIYEGDNDSPSLLIEDVMRAGAGHSKAETVTILAERGPELIREILLDRVGVQFDRTASGALSLAREGGHTLPRIIHAADATGKVISVALIKALQAHPQVTLLSGYTALDLLMSDQHARNGLAGSAPPSCMGADLLDQSQGGVIRCLARNTILATGGLGQIFARTTNPSGARGDGVAMAARAKARVINMEFVQFHPTTFHHPTAPPFLISEAVRGAGARLVDANGVPFMQKYDPVWKDLAPRDVVSRSIRQEMIKRGAPNVYLDLRSYISTDEIRSHFPTIRKTCLTYGIDIARDLVPVSPAAHYACGGVWVDAWGQTTLEGLYAVGEVACTGIHGANRLASTSLLEGLVWGDRAARHIRDWTRQRSFPQTTDVWPYEGLNLSLLRTAQLDTAAQREQYLKAIKDIMWQQVGLARATHSLERALEKLSRLQTDIEIYRRSYRPTDDLIGLRNTIQVALLVTTAALENKVGAGCHYRTPEPAEALALVAG